MLLFLEKTDIYEEKESNIILNFIYVPIGNSSNVAIEILKVEVKAPLSRITSLL